MQTKPLLAIALTLAIVAGCQTSSRQPDGVLVTAVGWRDPSPHRVRSVNVDDTHVEVLDWGGSGPAIVLLAGLGDTAHVFDDFAPALASEGHVYGITRRGFGASGELPADFDIATLCADIEHVLDALRIDRAHIVGHSVAGEEMTWLGAHARERVRSLVYLDAAYDRVALEAILRTARHPSSPTPDPPATESDLHDPLAYTAYVSRGLGMAVPLGEVLAGFAFAADGHFLRSMLREDSVARVRRAAIHPRYDGIDAPVLALFATSAPPGAPPELAAFSTAERAHLAAVLPRARVVALEAGHYVFLTARDAVLDAVRAFLREVSERSN
jgi:non-heme chloroperoxidase